MAKTTLHEKAIIAHQAVGLLRSFSNTIKEYGHEYDAAWPFSVARDMDEWVKELSSKLK